MHMNEYQVIFNTKLQLIFSLWHLRMLLQSEKWIDFNKLSIDSSIKLFWLA